ncbi:hypothetical protein BFJ72_g11843 [Fusarium proliferatum]|uniref:C2H2-type domain-containing protein n=1 Tax=Gibberella intermedia TaxID=948311 RepID=A0A420SK47_GIBIN|nr:hypothetical protein BFJ72_g11843 [Fusarium proliferatum]
MSPSDLRLYRHCPDIPGNPDNLRSNAVFGFDFRRGGGGGSGRVASRSTSGDTTHQQGDSSFKDEELQNSLSKTDITDSLDGSCPGDCAGDKYPTTSTEQIGERNCVGSDSEKLSPSFERSRNFVHDATINPGTEYSVTEPNTSNFTWSEITDDTSDTQYYTDSLGSSSGTDIAPSMSAIIERRKGHTLDLLMARLQGWLNSTLRERGGSDEQGSSEVPQSSATRVLNYLGQIPDRPPTQKRRREDSDDEYNENNDGEPDRNQRETWTMPEPTEMRYVCPFFKHNRERYQTSQWKSCCWPGWTSVYRVKEHLYRRHILPKFRCNRCRQDFKSASNLNEHQRADNICQRQNEDLAEEGINEEQERLLRIRKRKNGKSRQVTENEKWVDMYKILFPDDNPVPTPYPELCHLQPEQEVELPRANVLDSFEDYARREFSRRMRPRMESLVDGILGQALTSETITDVANNVLQGIMESFRENQNQETCQPGFQKSPSRGPSPQRMPIDGSIQVPQSRHTFEDGPYSNLEIDLDEILNSLDSNQSFDFGQWGAEDEGTNTFHTFALQVEQYNEANA